MRTSRTWETSAHSARESVLPSWASGRGPQTPTAARVHLPATDTVNRCLSFHETNQISPRSVVQQLHQGLELRGLWCKGFRIRNRGFRSRVYDASLTRRSPLSIPRVPLTSPQHSRRHGVPCDAAGQGRRGAGRAGAGEPDPSGGGPRPRGVLNPKPRTLNPKP